MTIRKPAHHAAARWTTALAVAAALLLAAAPAPVSAAAPPKVLGSVPADAPVVIVIRDLEGVSKKIAMLNDKLALDMAEMRDVLGMAKMMLGVNQGLDDGGDAALVLTRIPDPQGGGGDPDAVVLVPVADYGAFMKNFAVADADPAAVTSLELQGEPAFAKKLGGYAVVSNLKGVVEAYTGGDDPSAIAGKTGALGQATLAGSDVMAYIDFEKVGPMLQPMIDMGLQQAQMQMEATMPPGAELDMAKSMMALYGNVVNAFMRDARGVVIGLDLQEAGVGISLSSQFKPGSPLAQTFANAPAQPLKFGKLPTRPYMLAMAMDMESLPIKQWMNDFSAAFPDGHWISAMMKSSAGAFNAADGVMQQAYYGPAAGGAGPPSLMNSVAVVESANPKEYVEATRKSMAALNGVDLGQGLKMTTTYQDNVMQVAGHDVSQYTTRFTIPPELMQQLGPAAMFLAQGAGGYITTTDKAVVMTSGADPVLIKDAITAAEGKGQGLEADAGIVAIRKHLHPHRAAETYIGVGTIMQMVNGLLGMFAPDAVVPVPADLPPVAMSISVHSGGMSVREFVPMEVITTVKDVAMKFMGPQIGPGAAPAPAEPVVADSPNVVALSDADFDAKALKSDKVVLVNFMAPWSQDCRAQAPVINEVADKYKGKAVVANLDVDRNQETADKYGIQVIPTLLVIKDGKVVEKLEGTRKADTLSGAIDKAMK